MDSRKLVADAAHCGSDTYKNPVWRELCMKPPVERRNGLKRPPGERSRSDVSGRIVLAAYFSGTDVKELGISMIGSIGGFNPASYAAATALNRSKAVSSSDSSSSSSQSVGGGAKDDFLKYMKMSPGERMEENWLRAHGLSREKLAALPPKEREAIMKQMKQDIEKKLKDQTEQKAAKVDITV